MLVAWREVGARMFRPSLFLLILLRGTVMCSAYTSYVTAMVAMPLADTAAIYFTMPLSSPGPSRPFDAPLRLLCHHCRWQQKTVPWV